VAELVPVPFGVLVTRLLRELEERGSAFDLPARYFVHPEAGRDWSVSIHGRRVSTPFGPAAGPHTQLAQNVVQAWLVGGRFLELKTVQVKDDLVIPRPCIDMQTVGYNVEWSQELSLEQSLDEYVKSAMLVEILKAAGAARPERGASRELGDTIFDMSVGYDLAGIRSPRVQRFLAGMADAGAAVDRLRREIPARWAELRDLPFPTRISDTLTLSTFHGCPSGEVEQIADHLLEAGLHVVVKLNPTLLGREDLRAVLHDRLGYRDLRIPDAAFDNDPTWDQVAAMVERLGEKARRLGRGFGVKLTNTLVVENHRAFFPASEKVMYLSGPPLHALAAELVRRFRRAFGDRYPISFSAGVDAGNFPDLAAIGLAPITACTDLLRAGGYGRGRRYFTELSRRMAECGAADLEELAVKGLGNAAAALEELNLPPDRAAACRAALSSGGDLRAAAGNRFGAWVSAARVRNTETYVERVLADPRYREERNRAAPRKVGSKLAFFDCLTCDKCIPVCPNDANFSLDLPPGELPLERLIPSGSGRFALERTGTLTLRRERQIANYADACNECGHCDVLCPEDGGPYVVKPRFFGSVQSWAEPPAQDGFALEALPGGHRMHGRFGGKVFVVERVGARLRYQGEGFALELDPADPAGTAKGDAAGPVDLAYLRIMERLREAVVAPAAMNWVSAALGAGG
jgi:putative selenate reductase